MFKNSFRGYFKIVSRKIERYCEGDFNGVQVYLKELQREFQGSFKGISRLFQGSFKGFPRKLLGCFKEYYRVFPWSFK